MPTALKTLPTIAPVGAAPALLVLEETAAELEVVAVVTVLTVEDDEVAFEVVMVVFWTLLVAETLVLEEAEEAPNVVPAMASSDVISG